MEQFHSQKPALLTGGTLPPSISLPSNLAQVLASAARQSLPDSLVYRLPDDAESSHSYSVLLCEAESILAGLRRQGLLPGERVVLQLREAPALLPAFWACVLGGFVPVLLPPVRNATTPLGTLRRLAQAWERLGRPPLLASAQTVTHLDALGPDGFRLLILEELRCLPPESTWSPGEADDPALVMLTSGFTISAG